MRLKAVKLSGFKSFVDATHIAFPSHLTAILGPNGCGKSNVIDAIRWVMGESSARQLRGEVMNDVIFAGTSEKKAVSFASVELLFEQVQGALPGPYGHYAELAIKRQVTRDGVSSYFLNGTRCRRKDITDIFLGTGLGPRSYAVIEQGTIHRLVEARPEDLRLFIEEAAGVSRYQVRRKETEQHLTHTRENLARLDDILGEIANQMRSLRRQSQMVERYKTLQNKQYAIEARLSLLEQQNLSSQIALFDARIAQCNAHYLSARNARQSADDALNAATAALNELLQVAEIHQQQWQTAQRSADELHHQKQNLLAQQQQLARMHETLNHDLHEQQNQLALDEAQLSEYQQQIDQMTPELARLDQLEQLKLAAVIEAESLLRTINDQLKLAQQQHSTQQHNHQRSAQQMEQLTKQIARHTAQHHTWLEQKQQAEHAAAQQIDERQLQHIMTQLDQQLTHTKQQQKLADTHVVSVRKAQQAQQQLVQELKQQLAQAHGEMNVLQRYATVPSEQKKSTHSRLIDVLKLSTQGKSHIALIDAFLGQWMHANVYEQPAQMLSEAGQFAQGVVLVKTPPQLNWPAGILSLLTWVEQPCLSWLMHIGIAPTRDAANAALTSLPSHQSVISIDGFWQGQGWIINLLHPNDHESTGALVRQTQLAQLTTQQQILEQQLAAAQQQYIQAQQQVQQAEHTLAELTAQSSEHQQLLSQHTITIERALAKQSMARAQIDTAETQLQLTIQARSEDARELADLEGKHQRSQQALDALFEPVAQLSAALATAQEQRQRERDTHLLQLNARQQVMVKLENLRTRHDGFMQARTRLEIRLAQLAENLADNAAQTQAIEKALPLLIQNAESMQLEVDAAHQTWQTHQATLDIQQKQLQSAGIQRSTHLTQENDRRDELEQLRNTWHEVKNALTHLQERFSDIPAQQAENLQLFEALSFDELQRQQREIQASLAKMGELNLAAPTMMEELGSRHGELSHQVDDLQQTIVQLEGAMQTIDQETRQLFLSTFDQINSELTQLFPKIFGGGMALLKLEEDWRSGVKLMAQPPGKKNTSISLLSGGEKALTALALVFSIFKLNPAPFCLLDEVDAPLDDANVERFCNLLKDLSQQVQFIYITHNKLAMTMAHDLIGVTMPTAGISQVVKVNIAQAEQLVASA